MGERRIRKKKKKKQKESNLNLIIIKIMEMYVNLPKAVSYDLKSDSSLYNVIIM